MTHTPRLDLSNLSSILNSAQFNLSNLLSLQTLVNPDVLKLATLLASSQSNQENQEFFLNNHINSMNQHPNMHIQNSSMPSSLPSTQLLDKANLTFANDGEYFSGQMVNISDQTSQEKFVPPCSSSTDISAAQISYNPQFTSQTENLSFQPSNIENKIHASPKFDFDSVLSMPMSSSTNVSSSTTFINSSSPEDERGSHCSNMFKFEIPENFEFEDFI